MKKNLTVPAAAVVLGLVLFGIVFILDEQLPAGGVGLCAGLGGALIGLGGGSLFLPLAMAAMKPEDRREVERAERDERSIAIRTHAAYDSWYWTLWLLWVPFVIALVLGELVWMVITPVVLVLHCAFYMFHLYRWSGRWNFGGRPPGQYPVHPQSRGGAVCPPLRSGAAQRHRSRPWPSGHCVRGPGPAGTQ